jgi:hypothetical protein
LNVDNHHPFLSLPLPLCPYLAQAALHAAEEARGAAELQEAAAVQAYGRLSNELAVVKSSLEASQRTASERLELCRNLRTELLELKTALDGSLDFRAQLEARLADASFLAERSARECRRMEGELTGLRGQVAQLQAHIHAQASGVSGSSSTSRGSPDGKAFARSVTTGIVGGRVVVATPLDTSAVAAAAAPSVLGASGIGASAAGAGGLDGSFAVPAAGGPSLRTRGAGARRVLKSAVDMLVDGSGAAGGVGGGGSGSSATGVGGSAGSNVGSVSSGGAVVAAASVLELETRLRQLDADKSRILARCALGECV